MPDKKNELLLVIDVGTQSIRVSLVDLKGNIKNIVKTPIEPYYSVQPGWAEQDPEYYWKVLAQTCKKLLSVSHVDKKVIQCATITTQRDTMINVDKNGKPLRPAIIWLDQRRANKEAWPPFYLKAALKLVDMYDAIMYAYTECEANWLRQNQPEIWDKTYRFLFLSGYLTYRLTGEFIDSTGNQVGFIPFDVKKQDWADSSDMKWNTYPIEKEKFSKLALPGERMGQISKKAAAETGMPEGLPLIAAAADKACEVLGSGCLTPETACLSYGTTATLETTNKKYVEVIPFIPPFPSAVPGSFNTEVMIFRGYWMVSWFKKEFGMREEVIAKKKKIAPEVLFDSLIKDIPPGSMGLMLQPYWSPGVKVPGPEAKGSIIGFGDVHTRAHIYRAIIEGIAFALKEGGIRTEKRNKVKIEKLRVSGGGSQSKIAMQITADIFDLPAERPHTFETSSLGAAIDAAVGMKLYPDFDAAIKEMTHIKDAFEPIPANRDIYKKLFDNIYQKMYGKLKPLYSDIRHITGYPVER